MKDQGVGAIGLIGLAVGLTVLVTVFAPMAASNTTLELKDWIGFAGNILGALVTLIAAFIAWRAVQSQIGTQRDQILLEVSIREEDRIETQIPVLIDLCEISSSCIEQARAFAVEARLCCGQEMPRMIGLSGKAGDLQVFLSANVPKLIDKVPPETRSNVIQIYTSISNFAVACAVTNNELVKLIRGQETDGGFDDLIAACSRDFNQNLRELQIYIRYAENIRQRAHERISELRALSMKYRAEIERISESTRGS